MVFKVEAKTSERRQASQPPVLEKKAAKLGSHGIVAKLRGAN